MRPRVQRAPGLPRALFFLGRERNVMPRTKPCRENENPHLVVPAFAGTTRCGCLKLNQQRKKNLILRSIAQRCVSKDAPHMEPWFETRRRAALLTMSVVAT